MKWTPLDDPARHVMRRLADDPSIPVDLAEVLREGLAGQGCVPVPPGYRTVEDEAGGQVIVSDAPGGAVLPWIAQDRFGLPHWVALWGRSAEEAPNLRRAWFLLPGHSLLALIPHEFNGGRTDPLWGASDVLVHHPVPPEFGGVLPDDRTSEAVDGGDSWDCWRGGILVGRLPAQDYLRIRWIPPFDRPAALPFGAGEIVLNFLAQIADFQGAKSVGYRGPYPSSVLFNAMGRSFRLPPDRDEREVLTAFTKDEWPLAIAGTMAEHPLTWQPAPWTAEKPHPRLLLHRRGETWDGWLDGQPFRSTDASSPNLPAGARIWLDPESPGIRVGGVALLGEPWQEVFRLTARGELLNVNVPPSSPVPHPSSSGDSEEAVDSEKAVDAIRPLAPLHPRWKPVIFSWAVQESHPALAREILTLAGTHQLAWADLPLALVAAKGDMLGLQAGLGAQYRRLMKQSSPVTPGQQMTARMGAREPPKAHRTPEGLAMKLVSDVLEGLAPMLRRLAQDYVAQAVTKVGEGAAKEALRWRTEEGREAREQARASLQTALPLLVAAIIAGEALPEAR